MRVKIILFGIAGWVFLASPTQAIEEIFYKKDNQIYDSWRICRTRAEGVDGFFQVTKKGFRPIIAFESLGKNSDLAYKYGKEFLAKYSNSYQRAEKIFRFARDGVCPGSCGCDCLFAGISKSQCYSQILWPIRLDLG